jgi:hypothetical protein
MYIEIELDFPTGSGQSRIVGELAKSLAGKAEVVVQTNHMELAQQYIGHGVELARVRALSDRIPNQKDMLTVTCKDQSHQVTVIQRCRVLVSRRDALKAATFKGLEYHVDTWNNPIECGVRVIHVHTGIEHSERCHAGRFISATSKQFGLRQMCMEAIARQLKDAEAAKQLADPVVAIASAIMGAKRQGYAVKALALSLQMYNTLLVMEKMTRDDTQFMGYPYTVDPMQNTPIKIKATA